MMKFIQNTSNLFRVFFLVFLISLVGILWHGSDSFKTKVKSNGGTLREGIVGAPRFINPVLAQSQADHDLAALIFAPLLSLSHNGEVYFNLIETLDISEDKLVYTIALKDHLYFTDGQTLTSDDVIFTIEQTQDPLIKSPLYNKWQGAKATKIDNKNLTITLDQAFTDFTYNLELGILPKHIWMNINPEEFIFSTYNTEPIGSGPYKVKDVNKRENGIPSRYFLVRNEEYSYGSYIKHLNLHFFDNENEQVQSLKSGDIDALYGISPEKLKDLDLENYRIVTGKLPRVFALFFNTQKEDTVLTENLREAINLIIDKSAITQEVFSGYAKAIDSALGLESVGTLDREEALQIIEKENWEKNPQGIYSKEIKNISTELAFNVSIPNLQEMQAVASILKSQLADFGIVMNIKSYDQGNLNQNIIRTRDYEALLFGYELEKPSDLFAFWHSSQRADPGLNISLFTNSKVDIELQRLRDSENGSLETIKDYIQKDSPALFLYSPSFIYILPKNLKGSPESITQASDRFNNISDWYIRTRHVWSIFIKE